MAEGRGGGRESAMQRVQIPRRRGHEVTYTACFCRQAMVGVRLSRSQFVFTPPPDPKIKSNLWRAGMTEKWADIDYFMIRQRDD